MDIQSQNQHIYHLLVNGGTITSFDAMLHHHIGRCASRICDLINEYGVPVEKEWERSDDGARYIRYSISKENQARLVNVPLKNVYSITRV